MEGARQEKRRSLSRSFDSQFSHHSFTFPVQRKRSYRERRRRSSTTMRGRGALADQDASTCASRAGSDYTEYSFGAAPPHCGASLALGNHRPRSAKLGRRGPNRPRRPPPGRRGPLPHSIADRASCRSMEER